MADTTDIAVSSAREKRAFTTHTAVDRKDQHGGGATVFHLYRDAGKRVFDIGFVLVTAVFVVPLMLAMAALIARDGHSPFFRQERIGRGGTLFTIVKLRTMVPDAEAALKQIVSTDTDAAKEWAAHQKLRRDPRVTRIGAFLRRTSLDELPQFWNVLVGHMSLVGPRPMMPEQRSLYHGSAYFDLRPGITGLWQVSNRNKDTFASRAEYDERYGDEMSLRLDLKTLAQTAVVVLRGTGY